MSVGDSKRDPVGFNDLLGGVHSAELKLAEIRVKVRAGYKFYQLEHEHVDCLWLSVSAKSNEYFKSEAA
jgi:hypothetical protein